MFSTLPSRLPHLLRWFARSCAALVASLFLLSAHAQSPTFFATNTANNHLVSFTAAAPGTFIIDVALSGLTTGEVIVGLDFRPSGGVLYGIATNVAGNARIVKINPRSGLLTQVGNGITTALPSSALYGMAFNPVADRIRVVNSAELSIRLNPDTSVVTGIDANLAYGPTDPNSGVNPVVAHIAYSNSVVGATSTTLFGIDTALGVLVTVGGMLGSPSPNLGQLFTVGSLGISGLSATGGFDILAGSNAAFANLRVAGVSQLYTINLTTGAANLVGLIGTGTSSIKGLAVTSPSQCLDIDGDGIVDPLTDGLMLTRAMLGLTGTAVTNGALPAPTPPRSTWSVIQTHLNANCGMSFRP